MTTNSKFNEGQYGLKPWMANVIMGILELVMVVVWFLGSFLGGLSAMFSFDLAVIEDWDATTTIALCAGFLVWNCLVWFIKPLRTKFNWAEAKSNILFIIWLIVTTFFM